MGRDFPGMIHPASHCPLFVLSRGKGRSAVGAAAYIARCQMTDARVGRSFNYRRTTGLLTQGLVNWSGSAEELWNAAEAAEKRVNARVARELRPALPAELPLDEQRRLVHGFSCWLKDEFGVAVHYALHAPTFHDKALERDLWHARESVVGEEAYLQALSDPTRTNLNFHAHILFTTRQVDTETGALGAKTRDLDNVKTGPEKLLAIRKEWEKRANAALARAGSEARIDLRSYEEMAKAGDAPEGLTAQRHLGPRETARTRKRAKAKKTGPKSPAQIKREKVRDRNEDLWLSWMQLQSLQREKARLEDSARIAAEREAARRKRAEEEKRRIAEAQSVQEQREAVEQATTIDTPRGAPGGVLMEAIAWAKAGSTEESRMQEAAKGGDDKTGGAADLSEFDKVIDPETFISPDLGENKRTKRVKVRSERGNYERTRG